MSCCRRQRGVRRGSDWAAGCQMMEELVSAAERYGVSEEDWDRQVTAAVWSLERVAALSRVTSYIDLNREIAEKTGMKQFDFSHPEGRNAMARILGDVVDRTVDELRAMLSAVSSTLMATMPAQASINSRSPAN